MRLRNDISGLMNKDLWVCFTRDYDVKDNVDNGHLITSIASVGVDGFHFKFEGREELRDFRIRCILWLMHNNEVIINDLMQQYIIIVLNNDDEVSDVYNKFESVRREKGVYFSYDGYIWIKFPRSNINLLIISVDQLILNVKWRTTSNNLFSHIFGLLNDSSKDVNSILNNTLFIFNGMIWSNIVLMFKCCNWNISGGTISQRHIYHSVQFMLGSFMVDIMKNRSLVLKYLYETGKSKMVSSNISVDNVTKYLWDFGYMENKKISELGISTQISYNEGHLDKNSVNGMISPWEQKFRRCLNNNLKLSVKFLIQSIKQIYISNLNELVNSKENLNKEITEIKSRINDSSLDTNILSEKSSFSNVKKDKRLKKLLLSKNRDIELQIQSNNSKLNMKEESLFNLEKEINSLKLEINDFKLNHANWMYSNLIDLYNKLNKNNNNVNKEKTKFKKYNYKINRGMSTVRSYSTLILSNKNEISLPKVNIINNGNKNYFNNSALNNISALNDKNKIKNFKLNISNEMSKFFYDINLILKDTHLNDYEKQSKIENSWIDIMNEFYTNSDNFFKKNSHLLNKKLESAAKTLELMNKKGYLKRKFKYSYSYLNDIKLLMLTFMICMDSVQKKINYTMISRFVGNRILWFLYVNNKKKDELINTDKGEFAVFCNNLGFSKNEDFINLGDFFISIISNFPSSIFERVHKKYVSDEDETQNIMTLRINIENYDELIDNLIINPFSLPMICKPNLWNDEQCGGYLNNLINKEDIITGSESHGHSLSQRNSIYTTVNYLNNIKFNINNDLLNYISNTDNFELLDELFGGKSSTSLQNIITYFVAKLFENQTFFLPVNIDWRGRIYTQPFYLTYQGNDFALSLIEFNKGVKLDEKGIEKLYIYGANLYNENNTSKKRFSDRVNWVKKNKLKILNMEKDFINKAEHKLVFIAFCLVMKSLDKNPDYLVKLPIFLDATCSGIQHLAALLSDKTLASQVNLIKQSELDSPNDIYTNLLEPINTKVNKFGLSNPYHAVLSIIKLSRKEVKKAIMIKPYNATILGMGENLRDSLYNEIRDNKKIYFAYDKYGNKVEVNYEDILQMAKIIYNTIYTEYPSLAIIYSYFIDMSKLLNKLNLPIIWFTPMGTKLIQKYHKSSQRKIALSLGGKSKTMVLREFMNVINKHKQANALIPNIIHSLDGNHILKIVNNNFIHTDIPVITIHDCFGTLPNYMELLAHTVKKEFIELYTKYEFITEFHNTNLEFIQKNGFEIVEIKKENNNEFIKKKIKIKKFNKEIFIDIPEFPKKGDLNFEDIIQSQHMIT